MKMMMMSSRKRGSLVMVMMVLAMAIGSIRCGTGEVNNENEKKILCGKTHMLSNMQSFRGL